MERETIIKFIKHFQDKEIDLYWEEYYIQEKLIRVFDMIVKNDYSLNYNNIESNYTDAAFVLYVMDNLWLLEWGTSIRHSWIDHDLRDVFDMLHKLMIITLEWEECYILNMHIDNDDSYDRLEVNDASVKYLTNLLNKD